MAPTGRPPLYCSDACRRSAEFEIRRHVRRLEALETRRFDLQLDRAVLEARAAAEGDRTDWAEDIDLATVRLTAIEAEVRRCERRLRALLADDEVAP
jgi:hypothetical protein